MKTSSLSVKARLGTLVHAGLHGLLSVVRIQVILFLITLPILSAWGLPLSYASLVGNIMFAPLATLFLGLSTLWFVSYSVGLPTYWVCQALELLTTTWLKLLALGSPRFLFAIPKAPLLVLCAIPLSVAFILYSPLRARYGLARETVVLALIALSWCVGIRMLARSTKPVPLAHGGGTLWLHPNASTVDLVDSEGVLRVMPATSSWVRFTLSPALAHHFGACSCDKISIPKPTFRRLIAAANLIRQGKGNTLAVPEWVMQKAWFIKWKNHYPEIPCFAL